MEGETQISTRLICPDMIFQIAKQCNHDELIHMNATNPNVLLFAGI